MSFFFPPPPPFIGGAQPYAPSNLNPATEAVPVNNPPFTLGGPFWKQAEVVTLWQPPIWPYVYMGQGQPYEGLQLPPAVTNVIGTNPPFTYGGPIWAQAEIVLLAQPPIWPYVYMGQGQPYEGLQGSPAQLNVTVNNPPFTYGGPIWAQAEVVGVNQPTTWPYVYLAVVSGQPYAHQIFNNVLSVPINFPPPVFGGPTTTIQEYAAIAQPPIWPYDFLGGTQPYVPRRLPISVTAVPANQPIGYSLVKLQPPFVWEAELYNPQLPTSYSFKVAAELNFPYCKGYILG